MKERKELESAWELCNWNEACDSRNPFSFCFVWRFLKNLFDGFQKLVKLKKMVFNFFFLSTFQDGSISVGGLVLNKNCALACKKTLKWVQSTYLEKIRSEYHLSC